MNTQKVKIVNDFNGAEFDTFDTFEAAEPELDLMVDEFHDCNHGALCCLTIVDAELDWYCHPSRGWIWG
jgi:hypothetical protein